MFSKSLVIGGFNPIHKGHEELFQTALDFSESVTVRVGRKPKYDIPYDIRFSHVRAVARNLDNNRFNFLYVGEGEKISNVDTSEFDTLVLGSDVYSHHCSNYSKHRPQDFTFFGSFKNMIILQRPEFTL